MDTPLLHYNTGVAHYKSQQYARARESLIEASRYRPLQPLSHYNLGLNAYAQGDIDEALRWFATRETNDNEKISAAWRFAR